MAGQVVPQPLHERSDLGVAMVPPKEVGFDHRQVAWHPLLGKEHVFVDDPARSGSRGREQHFQFIECRTALRMAPGDKRFAAQPAPVQMRWIAEQDDIRVEVKGAVVLGESS